MEGSDMKPKQPLKRVVDNVYRSREGGRDATLECGHTIRVGAQCHMSYLLCPTCPPEVKESDIKIGSSLWTVGDRLNAHRNSAPPWTEHVVVGETKQSWLMKNVNIGWDTSTVSKKDLTSASKDRAYSASRRQFYKTDMKEEMDAQNIWMKAHADDVQRIVRDGGIKVLKIVHKALVDGHIMLAPLPSETYGLAPGAQAQQENP